MILSQFREECRYAEGFEVFRMDNSDEDSGPPDMRKHVGLGECSCCDYFFVRGNKTFIIEETNLSATISKLEKQASNLSEPHRQKYVDDIIRWENYAKVYGSLLVLCRLSAQCSEAMQLIKNKKYDFWFVITDEEPAPASQTFDNFKDRISSQLKGVLSKKVVDKVKIIHNAQLSEMLSQHISYATDTALREPISRR